MAMTVVCRQGKEGAKHTDQWGRNEEAGITGKETSGLRFRGRKITNPSLGTKHSF